MVSTKETLIFGTEAESTEVNVPANSTILITGINSRYIKEMSSKIVELVQNLKPKRNILVRSITVEGYGAARKRLDIFHSAALRILVGELTERMGLLFYAELIEFIFQEGISGYETMLLVPNRKYPPSNGIVDNDVAREVEHLAWKQKQQFNSAFSFMTLLSSGQAEMISGKIRDVLGLV